MTEKKYPIGGYAPGNYSCHCGTCEQPFIGDKRAFQCEICGIKSEAWYNSLTEEEKIEHGKKIMDAYNEIVNKKP